MNKEKRAFETLVVSELRKADEMPIDFSEDVELTKVESEALAGLGDEFLDLVIAGKTKIDLQDDSNSSNLEQVDSAELVLNRAEDVSDEDNDELIENERKLIEKKLSEREVNSDDDKSSSDGS